MPSSKQISSTLLGEFVAHGGSVTCLTFSPKTLRIVATGSEDKKVNLWPVCNKPSNCLASLSGHSSSVESVKFGRNEDILCVGCLEGSLKVWDLETAQILRTFSGHKASVTCIDFHPYGDFFASGSLDSNIKLWDTRKKSCMYAYKGHTNDVRCLRFSPDGRWLASGSDEGIIKIWDLAAGKILAEFNEHTAPVTDLTFHPNELLLTSSSMDGTVKFWDLETFSLVSATTNEAGPMHKMVYNTEGTILYSSARDLLKAFQWEPSRTLDTFVLNWGRVRDLAIDCNSHLLAASCNLMTMALFFLDLSGGKKSFANLTPDALNSLSNSFSTNLTLTSSISNTNLHSISSLKNTCSNLLSSPSLNNLASINDTSPLTLSNNSNNGSHYFQSYPLPMPTRLPPIANATKVNTNTNGNTSNNNNLKLSNNKVSKNNYTNQQNGNGSQNLSHSILHQSHLHPSTLVPNSNCTLGVNLKAPSTSSSTTSSSSNCEVSSAPMARQTKSSSLVFLEPHATPKGISPSNGHSGGSQINNKTNSAPLVVSSSPMVAVTSIQQQLQKDQIDSTPLSLELFPATGKDLHLRDESNLKASQQQQQTTSSHTFWSRLPPHIPSLVVAPDNSSVTKCETNKSSITSSNSLLAIASDASKNGTTNNGSNTGAKVPPATSTTTTLSQGKAAAIVFPEPQRQSVVKCKAIARRNSREDDLVDELIPETRDCPAGLDIDEFLPKHLQDTIRLGLHPAPEISETEAMTSIMRGHKSLVTALSHRKKNIQIILALWTSKDSIKALEQAVQLDDQSVIVDILNVINLKPSIWNLDVCQTLLPVILNLLQSKYECYMSVGCTCLKLILKNFASMIKTNITAPPGIGVDISREERYNKCMSCYNHLLNVRAFILKRQTLQGKLGRSFRELSILMQTLE